MGWLTYFITSFLISFTVVGFLAWKYKKTSRKYLYRFGGIGIIFSFVIAVLANSELIITRQIMALIVGGVLIISFGFWDDLKNLGWKMQLSFQTVIALLLVFSGYVIHYIVNPFGGLFRLDSIKINIFGQNIFLFSAAVIIFWVILIMNSINWADGIDGLSGGIGMLAAIAIFFVSLRVEVNQPAMAIIALIFCGSILGFWFWNFPPGKIEAGSSGSYFMGFILAAMAIMAGTKIATTLIVLIIPVFDAVWVIIERIKDGKWPMYKEEGKRHLHYKLRKLGLSDRKILVVYVGFLIAVLLFSLSGGNRETKLLILFLETLFVATILFALSHKIIKLK